jgi:hypothetical protein
MTFHTAISATDDLNHKPQEIRYIPRNTLAYALYHAMLQLIGVILQKHSIELACPQQRIYALSTRQCDVLLPSLFKLFIAHTQRECCGDVMP